MRKLISQFFWHIPELRSVEGRVLEVDLGFEGRFSALLLFAIRDFQLLGLLLRGIVEFLDLPRREYRVERHAYHVDARGKEEDDPPRCDGLLKRKVQSWFRIKVSCRN